MCSLKKLTQLRDKTVVCPKTPNMKRLICFLVMVIPFLSQGQDASSILKKTWQAYGGAAWDTVNYIRMHHIGHQNWLEQSENPQGPFITSYLDTEEIRSTTERKLYQKTEIKSFLSAEPAITISGQVDTIGYSAFGEKKMPLYYGYREENLKWMEYCPQYLLKQALKLNTKFDKALELEGVPHYQLSFVINKFSYKLFINANTFLISEAHIDTYSPYEFFYSLWGKFTTRIQYTLYTLHNGNIVYPSQWDVFRVGQLWKRMYISTITFSKTTDETVFDIPDDVRKTQMQKQNVNDTKLPIERAKEVAQGIFVIPGYWFTGWVEHSDGIVVIESPISQGYSIQLMNEVKKRYPTKKIKGVVVSSDAWPHLAGVREYMAANVPIYTSKLNEQILNRIAAADFSLAPDHLQLKKAIPQYKLVKDPITIDDKTSPVQILPMNGEGSERMVAVYFPNQKVLYASDLIQYSNGDFFFKQYLAEVKALVDRHKLDVQTVYAMHMMPLEWKKIETALDKNK